MNTYTQIGTIATLLMILVLGAVMPAVAHADSGYGGGSYGGYSYDGGYDGGYSYDGGYGGGSYYDGGYGGGYSYDGSYDGYDGYDDDSYYDGGYGGGYSYDGGYGGGSYYDGGYGGGGDSYDGYDVYDSYYYPNYYASTYYYPSSYSNYYYPANQVSVSVPGSVTKPVNVTRAVKPSYTSSFNTSYVDNSINDSYNTYDYSINDSYNTSINNSGNTTVATVAPATPQYPVYATLPPVVSYPSYYPSYPYLALSQIPYTGFDLGFLGNSLYFVALVAFALAAGYLIVYYMPSFNLGRTSVSRQMSAVVDAPTMFAFAAPAPISAPVSHRNSQERTYGTRYNDVSKDAMTFARSEKGAQRIVITRNY